MRTSDFDYELPERAIAQEPCVPRDGARLFAHHVRADRSEHCHVRDLPAVLARGDLLVLNDTRVRPARLCGRRASGGAVELLVLGPVPGESRARWRALVKPAKRVRPGDELELEGGRCRALAIARVPRVDGTPSAEWIVELYDPAAKSSDVDALLERVGRMPLPPYLHRSRDEDPFRESDRERYQTVYATRPGAVAAPTAGLHFTAELLAALEAHGLERASVTLHVGLGTFQPVEAEFVADHTMHHEEYVLDEATARAVDAARARGGRVVAVGTTSARVLETCADEHGSLRAGSGSTNLFLTPGRPLRCVDALLTNFHLPRSTLLMLVSTFAGRERILRLYAEALAAGYRFTSYGDAMLLLDR